MNVSGQIRPYNYEYFTQKEINILEKNKKFFAADRKYIDLMLKIINGESSLSIRVLDWFVTNYSKKYNTYYRIISNNRPEFFYVNNEYKNQLNGYSKQYFDPFCRKRKIIYTYIYTDGSPPVTFISSIGQLNFFQWAIHNKIIHYVKKHIGLIEHDMRDDMRENGKKTKSYHSENSSEDTTSCTSKDLSDTPDYEICSSDSFKRLNISPQKKKNCKSINTKRIKSGIYSSDPGIHKISRSIRLDFE
jgi:hypothetical protein